MIKIVVVEDQALVRDAIVALLDLHPSINVVGQAKDGEQALVLIENLLENTAIDIVLTDIEMPNLTGIELIEKIKKFAPEIRTVIMTTFARSGYIRRAIKAGVKGFILKESSSDDLIAAILKVQNGRTVIDPELAINALGDIDPLSSNERKALRLASNGLSTSEIAEALFLSHGTVRNYLSEAISKLNATNRIDAARLAHQKGWL